MFPQNVSDGIGLWFVELKEKCTMVKKNAVQKSVSPAVAKAVAATIVPPIVAEPVKTRGAKQFTSSQYIEEYKIETKTEGGSWKGLCERTGFNLNNVRQCITQERTAIRKAAFDRISAAPEVVQKKVLKNTQQPDCESYADYVAELELPYLAGDGERNTQSKQRRDSYATMELPGF